MQGYWLRIANRIGLTPLQRGLAEGGGVVGCFGLAVLLLVAFADPRPSAGLLENLAQVGATLLIAYVVEISWLVKAARSTSAEERENRLGAFVGVGASGLIGIGLALALVERASIGQWSGLNDLEFGWVVGSLSTLGIVVVLQPILVHEWMDAASDKDP